MGKPSEDDRPQNRNHRDIRKGEPDPRLTKSGKPDMRGQNSKATQFKRGEKPLNPGGRPVGSKNKQSKDLNIGTLWEKAFAQEIPAKINGVSSRMSIAEALINNIFQRAFAGDRAFVRIALDEMEKHRSTHRDGDIESELPADAALLVDEAIRSRAIQLREDLDREQEDMALAGLIDPVPRQQFLARRNRQEMERADAEAAQRAQDTPAAEKLEDILGSIIEMQRGWNAR